MDQKKNLKPPKIGLLTCNSGASNTGSLMGIAAIEIIWQSNILENMHIICGKYCRKCYKTFNNACDDNKKVKK